MTLSRTDSDRNLSYAETVHAALSTLYGPLRNAAKILAKTADTHPNTAKNWLRGKCSPGGEQLVSLMAADPDIATVILDLVAQRRRELKTIQKRVDAKHQALSRTLAPAPVGWVDVAGYQGWDRRGSARDMGDMAMACALRSVR